MLSGISSYASMFSSARIGSPQAIVPKRGRLYVFGIGFIPGIENISLL